MIGEDYASVARVTLSCSGIKRQRLIDRKMNLQVHLRVATACALLSFAENVVRRSSRLSITMTVNKLYFMEFCVQQNPLIVFGSRSEMVREVRYTKFKTTMNLSMGTVESGIRLLRFKHMLYIRTKLIRKINDFSVSSSCSINTDCTVVYMHFHKSISVFLAKCQNMLTINSKVRKIIEIL